MLLLTEPVIVDEKMATANSTYLGANVKILDENLLLLEDLKNDLDGFDSKLASDGYTGYFVFSIDSYIYGYDLNSNFTSLTNRAVRQDLYRRVIKDATFTRCYIRYPGRVNKGTPAPIIKKERHILLE